MDSELIRVVRERVILGYGDDTIRQELINAGYDDTTINEVLLEARSSNETVINGEVEGSLEISLPSGASLFKNGLSYARLRFDLALILAIPYVVLGLISYLMVVFPYFGEAVRPFLSVINLVVLIVYMFILATTLRILVTSNQEEESFSNSLSWARGNVLAYIWLNVLVTLVVIGGFMLLIVPGILLSIYFSIAQYVFAKEGLRGIDVLTRCRDLMSNNWLSVLSRFVYISFIFIGLFILVGLVFGLLTVSATESAVFEFLFNLVVQILAAGMTLIGMHVGLTIYSHLAANQPKGEQATVKGGKKKYITLALFGALFPLAMAGLFIWYFQSISSGQYNPYLEVQDEVRAEAKNRAVELRSGPEPQ